MLLIAHDSSARYWIQCPDDVEIRREVEADYLLVPDPDDPLKPYWLFDEILIAAVQDGEFGLRLLAKIPISMAVSPAPRPRLTGEQWNLN